MMSAFAQRADEALLKVGREHKAPITKWNDADWEYWDVASVMVRAGNGGHGCKAFLREKNRAWGGPCGGNGGRGGDVYLRCVRGAATLGSLGREVHFNAKGGGNGLGKHTNGEDGYHRFVDVPPGTCVYVRDVWLNKKKNQAPGKTELVTFEDVAKNLVGELTQPGQILRVARGGRGGKGNAVFKSQHNTAPWIFENGEKGAVRWLDLEIKLVSDIGIIGCPNAGKSSLLASVTRKRAKVAAYPFTTTVPNLGFYKANEHGGITIADVPGLIEGAAEGRGMGIKFLRHVERCKTLIHMVSADSEDPLGDYDQIQKELAHYSTEVALKPQVIVVNKVDIPEAAERLPELMKALRTRCGHSRVFDVSVATKYHLDELMARVYKWHMSVVRKTSMRGISDAEAGLVGDTRILTQLGGAVDEVVVDKEKVKLDPEFPKTKPKKGQWEPTMEWDVFEEAWRLKHPKVEDIASKTNFNFPDALDRFNNVCKAVGMTEVMESMGLEEGEWIIVANHRFAYAPGRVGSDSRLLIYDLDIDIGMDEPEEQDVYY